MHKRFLLAISTSYNIDNLFKAFVSHGRWMAMPCLSVSNWILSRHCFAKWLVCEPLMNLHGRGVWDWTLLDWIFYDSLVWSDLKRCLAVVWCLLERRDSLPVLWKLHARIIDKPVVILLAWGGSWRLPWGIICVFLLHLRRIVTKALVMRFRNFAWFLQASFNSWCLEVGLPRRQRSFSLRRFGLFFDSPLLW